jgi:hypothetical protein
MGREPWSPQWIGCEAKCGLKCFNVSSHWPTDPSRLRGERLVEVQVKIRDLEEKKAGTCIFGKHNEGLHKVEREKFR